MYGYQHELRHRLALTIRSAACFALLPVVACASKRTLPLSCDFVPSNSNPTATLGATQRFREDSAFRRDCLRKSLVNHENSYSKVRLTRYDEHHWGRLPVATFKSRPIVPEDLGKPPPILDASWISIPSGVFANSTAGLEQRGKQMFTRFPAQVERAMFPILQSKDGPARYGVWQTPQSVGGMVWVALPGGVYPSLTCSSCHAALDRNGTLRLGLPNHRLDLGKAKDDYLATRSLYSTWGPGREDIAADGKDNPVVIADVRAVRFEQYLHRTANVRNSLIGLALRVETGLIVAHFEEVRPDPGDAFALAYYLWSLGETFNLDSPKHHPARRIFEQHCARCHAGPSHAGPPVPAESIESSVAQMRNFARGTGNLQAISLLGVADRKLMLYGGEVKSIDELLDPNRNVGGHYVGRSLTADERAALRDYLEKL